MSLLGQALRPARVAADAAGRIALAALDRALASSYADEAVRRVVASPVADHAVGYALGGRLVDTVARDAARYAVLERVLDELLRGDALEGMADRVIDSRLPHAIVERLLASPELWRVVDEIANSPAVTDAIGQQSAGFADQVGEQVRARSRIADAGVERAARRLLRRKPPPLSPGEREPA